MFYYQRGFIPRITMMLGVLIPSIFFIRSTIFFVPRYISSINGQPFLIVMDKSIDLIVAILLYLTIPFYLGFFLSGLFPMIRISSHGIEIKYFGGIIRKKILWREIERIRKLNGGYCAIVISVSGLPLLKGLHFNELYGRLVRCGNPVVLLSPKIKGINILIEEIAGKIQVL